MQSQFSKLTTNFLIPSVVAKTDDEFSEIFNNVIKENLDVEWYSFIQHAGKFTPLIRTLCSKIPPPHNKWNYQRLLRIYLDQVYLHHKARNRNILKIVKELSAEFKKENLDVIFFKGAALLNTVYASDMGLRPVEDIDLIVKSKDLDKSEEILRKIGFKEDYPSSNDPVLDGRRFFDQTHFHYVYSRNSFIVELHWNLSFEIEQDTLDRLFLTSQFVELENLKLRVPSEEMQIVVSTLNLIHDTLIPLKADWKNEDWLVRRVVFSLLAYVVELGKLIDFYQSSLSWTLLAETLSEIPDQRITKLIYLASVLNEKKISSIQIDPSYRSLCDSYAKTDLLKVIDSLCFEQNS